MPSGQRSVLPTFHQQGAREGTDQPLVHDPLGEGGGVGRVHQGQVVGAGWDSGKEGQGILLEDPGPALEAEAGDVRLEGVQRRRVPFHEVGGGGSP